MKPHTIFWLVIIVCILLTLLLSPGLIRFWPFTATEFVQLITPLVLVALIIERTLEVFVTAWRGEESATRSLEISQVRALSERALKDKQTAVVEQEKALVSYKSKTQRIAFFGGVTLGVIVSALGIRALELFVDPAVFSSLTGVQRSLFHGVDVLLTGALIGGGADGLHKLVSVFTDFLDKTRKTLAVK